MLRFASIARIVSSVLLKTKGGAVENRVTVSPDKKRCTVQY
jgi:hypothetical protein